MRRFFRIWVVLLFCLPVLAAGDISLVEALRARALPLENSAGLDPLVARAGSRKLVLLGESTHGTSEFYRWRAALSQRLIAEAGYRFVAVEGDWAAIYRLNRYVKDLPGAEPDARVIMASFERWPQWMWANEEMLAFVEWLREWNLQRVPAQRAGLYGIDVYGDDTVLEKLLLKARRVDEELAAELVDIYAPFRAFAGNGRAYAMHLARGGTSFAEGAGSALALLEDRLAALAEINPQVVLNLLHSARVLINAERHYRANVDTNLHGWNARADHFYLTAETLLAHYGDGAQGIVWAHNTHVGDARATGMSADGSRNIGQAARQALGSENVLAVGFGTDRGSVVAGRNWGGPREVMNIPSGGDGTLEAAMASLGIPEILFMLDDSGEEPALLRVVGHRAIGVIYHPEREFPGNYVPTVLPNRYDAFIFIRETKALQVIE